MLESQVYSFSKKNLYYYLPSIPINHKLPVFKKIQALFQRNPLFFIKMCTFKSALVVADKSHHRGSPF